jgi:hypothetical protein
MEAGEGPAISSGGGGHGEGHDGYVGLSGPSVDSQHVLIGHPATYIGDITSKTVLKRYRATSYCSLSWDTKRGETGWFYDRKAGGHVEGQFRHSGLLPGDASLLKRSLVPLEAMAWVSLNIKQFGFT